MNPADLALRWGPDDRVTVEVESVHDGHKTFRVTVYALPGGLPQLSCSGQAWQCERQACVHRTQALARLAAAGLLAGFGLGFLERPGSLPEPAEDLFEVWGGAKP